MKYLLKIFPFVLIILLSSCIPFKEEEFSCVQQVLPWIHLELGGGNYGIDGHTKRSQRKTVLQDFTYVSKAPNYIDKLPESDPQPYDPKCQYAVLFWTLDQLIAQRGPEGIFHVNDLYEDYAKYAVKHLSHYAKERGYNQVIIEPVVGDYMQLLPIKTLAKYGQTHYDTVHLKNPELPFYNYGMDGDKMLSNEESRKKARIKLQHLANFSKEGLYFFTRELDDGFIFLPQIEKEQFVNKGIFYLPTTLWEPVPYYFPEGGILDKELGRVYFIKNHANN